MRMRRKCWLRLENNSLINRKNRLREYQNIETLVFLKPILDQVWSLEQISYFPNGTKIPTPKSMPNAVTSSSIAIGVKP